MSNETATTSLNDVIESVAISNIKSVAEQPAMLSNLAYSNLVSNTNVSQQNAVSNQQQMNELSVALLSLIVKSFANSIGSETLVDKSTPS